MGHVKFEMPSRHPSRDEAYAVGYMSLELRRVVQAVDIKLIDIRGELVSKVLSLSADQEKRSKD